jgi:hypothetical protein
MLQDDQYSKQVHFDQRQDAPRARRPPHEGKEDRTHPDDALWREPGSARARRDELE